VEADKPPTELKERWKVIEKMCMVPQYAFAGDFTGKIFYHCAMFSSMLSAAVEAIAKGMIEVAKYDAGNQRDLIRGLILLI